MTIPRALAVLLAGAGAGRGGSVTGEGGAPAAGDAPVDPAACGAEVEARLVRFGRRLRARCEVVGGYPVLVHPVTGRWFAAAFGARSLAVLGPSAWAVFDAWPDDVTFRRGDDAVLHALTAAMDAAGAPLPDELA